MNSLRNRRLAALIFIFMVIIVVVLLIVIASKSPKPAYDPRANREPESSGLQLITLSGSEKLSKLLLPSQFDVAKVAINDFVKAGVNNGAKNVTIIGDPQINDRGVVTLSLRVDGPSPITFTAKIDKWTYYNKLIFSVPEKGYTVTIPVYIN